MKNNFKIVGILANVTMC